MAAAEVRTEGWTTRLRVFLKSTPKITLVWVALNTLVPLGVLIFVVIGGKAVVNSRAIASNAIEQKNKALEETRQALQEKNRALDEKATALREMRAAVAAKEAAEIETRELLAEQNRLREDNARLSQDPDAVIRRIKQELGGRTPTVRADSLYKRGRDAFEDGNLKLAQALYMASLEEEDRYVWSLIGLGNVASKQHNYHVAEKHFKRAVEVEPENKVANFNLASVSAALKKWDQAEEYLRKTLALDPTYELARKLEVQLKNRQ